MMGLSDTAQHGPVQEKRAWHLPANPAGPDAGSWSAHGLDVIRLGTALAEV